MGQLSFSDIKLGQSRKPSRVMAKLDKINEIVDWDNVLDFIKSVDKTSKRTGGAPHRELLVKVKMFFLQHLYNLSDPELEDQVNDRLSFQHFPGISYFLIFTSDIYGGTNYNKWGDIDVDIIGDEAFIYASFPTNESETSGVWAYKMKYNPR